MESLNLQDETPKEDGDPGEKDKVDEEDEDNGADLMLCVRRPRPLYLHLPKLCLEAESAAEGDTQLVPVAKPKAKPDRPLATVASPDAIASLRGFLRSPLLVADGGDSDPAAPAPANPLPIAPSPPRSSLKRRGSRPPSKSRGRSQSHAGKKDDRDRSRTRTSPERTNPLGAIPCCLLDRPSLPPRAEDIMPSDLDSVPLKADFLQWILRSLEHVHAAREPLHVYSFQILGRTSPLPCGLLNLR